MPATVAQAYPDALKFIASNGRQLASELIERLTVRVEDLHHSIQALQMQDSEVCCTAVLCPSLVVVNSDSDCQCVEPSIISAPVCGLLSVCLLSVCCFGAAGDTVRHSVPDCVRNSGSVADGNRYRS
jgi:hypothetical protein